MNKWAVSWLALVASTSLQAATNLHIKSGETHTLDGKQTEWVLDELVLEDNATLVIPAALGQVQIDAVRAVIGSGARILAAGEAGAAGKAGATSEGVAEKCVDGTAGKHGEHGAAGGDGVAVNLTLRIAKLGSLQIDAQGGVGGDGGAGGKGQDAGEFDTCDAPRGGEGGRGGDGGDGGNGGHVRVFYTLLPESGITGSLGDRIKVDATGGEGGNGGEGGKGGEGGPGKFVTMKTLSGNKKWVAGGKPGANGANGKIGRDGGKGQVLVQQDLRSRMDELAQQQTAQAQAISSQVAAQLAEGQAASQASVQQSVQALNQEVDALKLTLAGAATQTMVQQQGSDLAARTSKLEQTLETILKRLEAVEKQLDNLTRKSAATPSAPAAP
jgi:hypothetical protein